MATQWVFKQDLYDPTNPDADEAARAASMIMYALSGRKYRGTREVTEFYEPPETCAGFRLTDVILRQVNTCVFHRRGRLPLRNRPVRSVAEVIIHPEVAPRIIDASEYQVVDRAFLRPTFGASWSPCSTLQVTYTAGTPIPESGLRAARLLGDELLKARCGDGTCQLPDRVTSVSRQGVSFTILDPQDFIKDGRTGLYEVDLFLNSVNPDKARKRARVFSPDLPRAGRVTS